MSPGRQCRHTKAARNWFQTKCGGVRREFGLPRCLQKRDTGAKGGLMFLMTDLPQHDLYGLIVRPGDILGRTTPAAIFEHRFLLGFDGQIAHSPGPSDVFRSGWLAEVLKDGGVEGDQPASNAAAPRPRRSGNRRNLFDSESRAGHQGVYGEVVKPLASLHERNHAYDQSDHAEDQAKYAQPGAKSRCRIACVPCPPELANPPYFP